MINPNHLGDLTEAERKMLMGPIWGVGVGQVYHRPEFHSLMKKGLLTYGDEGRRYDRPSFYLRLTPAGKALKEEINGQRVAAGDH